MLLGKLVKYPLDIRRFTVDFSDFLDDVEELTGFSTPVVTRIYSTNRDINGGEYVLPADLTPLVVRNAFMLPDNKQVQLFVQDGTVGTTYRLAFVATGMSTRAQSVELDITVRGV